MDLILFSIILALSVILIALGLFRPEHTELSLIGFIFLFLMAILILNNEIDYKIGTQTNSTFIYTTNASGTNLTLLTSSEETVADLYGTITLGSTLSHTVGYWLAIASVIGFVGVLLGLRKSRGFE